MACLDPHRRQLPGASMWQPWSRTQVGCRGALAKNKMLSFRFFSPKLLRRSRKAATHPALLARNLRPCMADWLPC